MRTIFTLIHYSTEFAVVLAGSSGHLQFLWVNSEGGLKMRTCCLTESLTPVLELFYAATQLPITTFTHAEGHPCPHCQGTASPGSCLYKEGEIETPEGNLYILPICPRCKRLGMFVIGPYTSKPSVNSQLSYRPQDVWDHLTSLLRNLQTKYSGSQVCGSHCLPVARARRIVEDEYDQEITLEGVASRLGLNHTYLSTLFKEETGRAFTNFVQEVRVEKSKELLIQTRLPVLEVALSVGFSSQNYYSRIFKKLTGCTPSEFRKQSKIVPA